MVFGFGRKKKLSPWSVIPTITPPRVYVQTHLPLFAAGFRLRFFFVETLNAPKTDMPYGEGRTREDFEALLATISEIDSLTEVRYYPNYLAASTDDRGDLKLIGKALREYFGWGDNLDIIPVETEEDEDRMREWGRQQNPPVTWVVGGY